MMCDHGKISWFAVQVTPRHEMTVNTLLSYKGYEQFLPLCTVRRNWSDRVKTLEQPLFPGYLFCRSPHSTLGSILRTPGVIRIISFGGQPYPVPDDEIGDLQQAVQCGRKKYCVPYLAIGQRVEIKAGPLTGIVGIITKFKNRDRLVLSVASIMKAVAIDIEACEVASVGPAPVHRVTSKYCYQRSA
jgi:transcription antitermination factor NusG